MTETHTHTHEDNFALQNNFEREALQMALVTEFSNRATAEINIGFYTYKLANGQELDMAEAADKDFWERNLIKINQKIAFVEAQLANTSA